MAGYDAQTGILHIPIAVFTAIIGVVITIIYIYKQRSKERLESQSYDKLFDSKEEKDDGQGGRDSSNQAVSKKRAKFASNKKFPSPPASTHPLLLTTLKGHISDVIDIDFSINAKYLASTSEDRSVRLWSVKEFKSKDHRYLRVNVELDHGSRISISPDVRAFIVSLGQANTIRVFKIGKKGDGSGEITHAYDFPLKHKNEIIALNIAPTGKYIMSCSKDTTLIIWSLKGEILCQIDTLQVMNTYAAISPCGKFVATSGFVSDVKIWEVEFTKSDEYSKVSRAMELKGHKAAVYSFNFSDDVSRMATVSKDGYWKIWDISVHYRLDQDPRCIMTGSCHTTGFSFIALSPDARTVAIASGTRIDFFFAYDAKLDETIKDVHGEMLMAIKWHPSSKYLASAGGNDRSVRIWYNVTGLKATIMDLTNRLRRATSETIKERLRLQLDDAKASLAEIFERNK